MTLSTIGILFYILLQLAIGAWVSRSVRTEDDYLLAGRKLGFTLATFSIFATWFGAESCIGVAGAAFEHGLGGVTADPFGYAACLLLMGLIFAIPLYKLRLTTVADFMRIRFSASTERLTAIIMIPTSLLWAAAQIRAFGMVLTTTSDFNATVTVTIAAAIVILYTSMGGLMADAITDLVQGIVLIAGLAILAILVLQGTSLTLDNIRTELAGSHTYPGSLLSSIEAWAVPICGSLFAQELVSRILGSRSETVARGSTITAAILYLTIGFIPVVIGLGARALNMEPSQPEAILPEMAKSTMPPLLYVLFSGAVISAILSTVDSALLACASLAVRNILRPTLHDLPHARPVMWNRLAVLFCGVLAWLLALHAEGVYDLVKDASSLGSSGVFIVLVFGLFTNLGQSASAKSALLLGTTIWLIANYVYNFEYSYLTSLAGAAAGYVGTAGIGKKSQNEKSFP